MKFGIFAQFWAPKNRMLWLDFLITAFSRFLGVYFPSRCQILALYL